MRLKEIDVRRYFLLRDVRIEPGRLCVIGGDNESGKTTLLDAVLDALFGVRGRRERRFFPGFNRYDLSEPQDVRVVVVEDSGAEQVYDGRKRLDEAFAMKGGDMFLLLRNLLVVRDSRLEIGPAAEATRWWNFLRRQLSGLAGGLARVKSLVAEEVGITVRGRWANIGERRTRDDVRRIEAELAQLRAVEAEAADLEREKADAERMAEEERRLEAELARMERLRQKAVCLRAKAELAEVERLKEAIARLAAAGPQVMDRWRDAEARARALSEAMSELANRYQAQEKEAQRKEGDAAQMRRRAAEWERKEVELLPQLEDMLVALKRLHQERRTAGRRRPLLVITVVTGLLLSAVFGVLAVTQTPALWALCAVGVVATAGGLMTIMRDRRLTGAVQAAKDELFVLFQSVGEQASDIDEMERWIETGRAGSRESRARAELLFMEATRDRAQLEELAKLMQARQQALDEAQREVGSLRHQTGCDSLSELEALITRKSTFQRELAARTESLNQMLGVPEEQWFKRLTELEQFLSEEGDYDPIKEEDIRRRLPEARELKVQMEQRIGEIEKTLATLGCHGPEEIWVRKAVLQEKLAEHLHRREAALLAISVVDSLASDQDALINAALSGNADSASAHLARFTGGQYTAVLWRDESLFVQTASGDTIAASFLSAGTRTQLLFATRLALLERLLGETRTFLLLDDPFLSCDPTRLQRLLEGLLDLSRHGWQIIYFTVDRDVMDWALARHDEGVTTHHLPPLSL